MNPRLRYSLQHHPVPPDEKNNGNTYLIGAGHQSPHDDLHFAAARGLVAEMIAILNNDPGALNRFHSLHGTTPICWAIAADQQSAIKLLLDYDAQVILTKHPFVFYHPLHFLNYTDEYARTDIIEYLFSNAAAWIKNTYRYANELPHESVINLLQSIFLLLRHEYYDFTGEVEKRILGLKHLLEKFILPDELKIINHISLLHIQHLVYDEMVMSTMMSQAVAELALSLRRQFELALEEIPQTVRSEDLSVEIFLHANTLTEENATTDNLFMLCYSIADQLAQGGSLNLRAAIHLKKSMQLCSMEEYPTLDVDCMIEVRKALILLKEIKFKNYPLASLLFTAAMKVAANTSVGNTTVIFEMLALVAPLSPKNSLTTRASIAFKLLHANFMSEENRSDDALKLLSDVVTTQFNDTQACLMKNKNHAAFVEDTIKMIVNSELQRFLIMPKRALEIFKNCIYIVSNYQGATDDPQLGRYLNNIIYDLVSELNRRILSKFDVVVSLKQLFDEFLSEVLHLTNNLCFKAAYADFQIKMYNTDYGLYLYQSLLFEALPFEWDFFQEVLLTMQLIARDVLCDEALLHSITALHFYSKALTKDFSLQMIDSFIQSYVNTGQLAAKYEWLARLYFLVANKFISDSSTPELLQRNQIFKQKMALVNGQALALAGLQTHGLFALPNTRQSMGGSIDGLTGSVAGIRLATRL
jgi:hypothetical protein